MLAIKSPMAWRAPAPTASRAMTAMTPMMSPSMVSAERILFTRRARKEIFTGRIQINHFRVLLLPTLLSASTISSKSGNPII